MNHWLSLNAVAAKFAFQRLFRQPVGNLLILLMLGIAISLPLALHLGVQSTQNLVGNLSANPQLTVFLAHEADDLDAKNVKKTLEQDRRIGKIHFVNRDDALSNMQKSMGDADLISLLDENPLPHAFIITPAEHDPDAITTMQRDLAHLPMVDDVQLDAKWLKTLYQIKVFLQRILIFLAITLGLAFILVTHNTIRLQTLARKEEIEVTKLLGAPASFIRRPFLYLAFWQGLFSMIIGILITAWLFHQFTPQISEIFTPYGVHFEWRFFNGTEIFLLFCLVILLTIIGAWLAVWQHMKDFAAK